MGKTLIPVLCIGLIFSVLPTMGGQWDKATTVTFAQPVELPNIVLPAGTYIFKLADVPTSRHVVQVFNADETKLITTILALPNYRLTPTDKTVMPFEERAPGMPQALRAWFYPDNTFGQEFVYPKARAAELAQTTQEPVLAAEVKPSETPEELIQEPVVEVTPEQKEVEVAVETKPAEPTLEPPPVPASAPELPKTASLLPLVGLLGLSSLVLAVALRLLSRRIS